MDWNPNKGDVNRCFKENNKEYCFCDQNMKYRCNSASRTVSLALPPLIAVLILYWL